MLVISPLQYFIEGILHLEYGYGIQHRIFGQYKFNKLMGITTSDSIRNFRPTMLQAVLDAIIFMVLPFAELFKLKSGNVELSNGKIMGIDTNLILNGILLTIFQFWRCRSIYVESTSMKIINIILSAITLLFIFEEKKIEAIAHVIYNPSIVFSILFVILLVSLKNQCRCSFGMLSRKKEWQDNQIF